MQSLSEGGKEEERIVCLVEDISENGDIGGLTYRRGRESPDRGRRRRLLPIGLHPRGLRETRQRRGSDCP